MEVPDKLEIALSRYHHQNSLAQQVKYLHLTQIGHISYIG